MTQAYFFLFCGELVRTEVVEEGNPPHKAFMVHFYYTKGHASFDGAHWRHSLEGNGL